MTKHGIEDTIHFNGDDLDFIKNEKIDVEKGLIYSGRGQGSFIVFVTGPDKGNVIAINKDKMVIGRDKSADIFIDKNFVSKKHAKIVTIDSKTIITDFGSRNGTFLNETPVKNALLKDQDEIRIGDIVIKYFRIDLDDRSLSQLLPSDGDKAYTDFYNQVFSELKPFFGQMTDRFLTRQITAHVGKTPYTISVADSPVLAKWVKISAGLLLDEETAAKLADKILALK